MKVNDWMTATIRAALHEAECARACMRRVKEGIDQEGRPDDYEWAALADCSIELVERALKEVLREIVREKEALSP